MAAYCAQKTTKNMQYRTLGDGHATPAYITIYLPWQVLSSQFRRVHALGGFLDLIEDQKTYYQTLWKGSQHVLN